MYFFLFGWCCQHLYNHIIRHCVTLCFCCFGMLVPLMGSSDVQTHERASWLSSCCDHFDSTPFPLVPNRNGWTGFLFYSWIETLSNTMAIKSTVGESWFVNIEIETTVGDALKHTCTSCLPKHLWPFLPENSSTTNHTGSLCSLLRYHQKQVHPNLGQGFFCCIHAYFVVCFLVQK